MYFSNIIMKYDVFSKIIMKFIFLFWVWWRDNIWPPDGAMGCCYCLPAHQLFDEKLELTKERSDQWNQRVLANKATQQ